MDLTCPKCASDNTQKISSIVESGTTKTTGRTSSVGIGAGRGGLGIGSAVGTVNATSQTALAKKLAPPALRLVWPIYMGIAGMGYLGLASLKDHSWFIFLVACGLAWWFIKVAMKEKAYNRDVYPALLSTWQDGFYCHRCDTSFIPK